MRPLTEQQLLLMGSMVRLERVLLKLCNQAYEAARCGNYRLVDRCKRRLARCVRWYGAR